MKPVRVGICGLGTVGSGTFNVLTRNADEIARRAGRPIVIEQVGARRENPDCDTTGVKVTSDIFEVARNPDIDVLVELVGGYDVARELVLTAIENGKHVVTANKALIAVYGNEIFKAAHDKGVIVAFEAAVAGGIPVIKSLREGLGANRIQWLAGIINGTGNYILTHMRDEGRAFEDVLAEAQALGYAEADPTFDVEGIDAAHKLTILASIAYGVPLQFDKAYTEGISRITAEDVEQADNLGYIIKHLGISKRTEAGLELRVHPTLIPKERLLASVHGVKNAIAVMGDAVGPTLYYGAGAGSEPTASAVVADLLDVARDITTAHHYRVPYLAFSGIVEGDNSLPILPMEDIVTAYYLRLLAVDRPGVLARVATILSEQGISIEAIIQKEATEGELVPIILLTHRTREKNMNEAIRQLESLADIAGPITRIRVECLDEQQ
ncbi:homoserine dehydrogenase [Halomonas sp. McH1-25]|uniref:homoserine dehydrogenase n=1 Tax=unclassified Halomonas TaxID=2609666 RepID=UPI001EF55355|nr:MULTISPECIES: homoserine dehydrogenase [unclassified Halomonas]MCG7601700.1 homoserine dehydrogenase [Halomonas sp. McH1-25]MCP1343307.1 homoserine dehydrogenase [Halomonas sp. FL8]MCP1360677.1 homoserine dehydrogenase [Halomonas sp. BBD45]